MMRYLFSKPTQTIIDLITLGLGLFLAFELRFEWSLPEHMTTVMLFHLPYIIGIQYLAMNISGIRRYAWRYIGLREISRIFSVLAASAIFLLGPRLLVEYASQESLISSYSGIPVSVIAIDFMLAFLGISGVRVLRRLISEREQSSRLARPREAVRTILIGAGQAGMIIAKEIASRPDLGIEPLGFIDDDPSKKGMVIHGIPVLGNTAEIHTISKELNITQAIITISNAPGEVIRKMAKRCEHAGLPAKIVPGIHQLIDGKINLTQIRDVSLEDLLRREAVQLDVENIEAFLTGKRALVTGAGGSIGSELCRQVALFKPAQLFLIERSEFQLFAIHRELTLSFPELSIVPLICDICDETRVEDLFALHQPQVVFHAAAHKHVPMMEMNPGEAIKNNIFGTKKIADAANHHGVEAFVMVSTDKAVNPTSVMGATKRVAEVYIQALSQRSKTRYVAVRFGNVLGSTGSVIPIFKEQIARGGPVTVTHPEMKRYFMTIPEASQLIMQAATMGEGGEIFVLDMGAPVKIVDLASDLIRLSGFEPEIDIPIEFVGVRPGEKLFEELGFDAEQMNRTRHEKIFVGTLSPSPLEEVTASLSRLASFTQENNRERVRAALLRAVPEMQDDATEAFLDPEQGEASERSRSLRESLTTWAVSQPKPA